MPLHRRHAVFEDRVRVAKQTGLGHPPSASWRVNTAWTLLAAIAGDLDTWTRLLSFHDDTVLCKAEPATMRELVCRLPAGLAHHARTRWLPFNRDHPSTDATATARQRLADLAATRPRTTSPRARSRSTGTPPGRTRRTQRHAAAKHAQS